MCSSRPAPEGPVSRTRERETDNLRRPSRTLHLRPILASALAMLAACAPAPAVSSSAPAVRADLVVIPDERTDDPSLLVTQYREWDAEGRAISDIELDHGHGPMDVDDGDEVVVVARVRGQPLPLQAVDADGDRVIVDLDALPLGPHVLHLTVVHDGLTSDALAVRVLDRRLQTP